LGGVKICRRSVRSNSEKNCFTCAVKFSAVRSLLRMGWRPPIKSAGLN
jgi:hypothetical protein